MEYRPYEYQTYCKDRIVRDKAVGLFLEMGLGKTVITLTAINELKYARFEVSKVLVIAPKKVAEATWTTEAEKWDHLQHLRISPVLGTRAQREKALEAQADVYIINRENTMWLIEQYPSEWPFDMVVIDELTSFKSHAAKRFKALTWIRDDIQRIVGLTGTPRPRSLMDLWAQVYLLDKGRRLGRTITAFRQAYFRADTHGGHFTTYEELPGASDIVRDKISDICVSMKSEDYLQLPELTMVTVPVVLDVKALKAYKQMERDALLEVDEEEITAMSAAALSNKLQQLCNGAVYNEDGDFVRVHDCKIEALLELIEIAQGAPLLVFYSFRSDRVRILEALEGSDLQVGELKSPEDIDRWNRGEINVLLAHPGSAAYGLNLQEGGSRIIWFGLSWSLELYQQANARLFRQGQKENVIVTHLVVQGGRDEDVMRALERKDGAQEELMESLKVRIEEAKADDR